MKKLLLLILSMPLVFTGVSAQCPAGQSEVYINVRTDQYGYEAYWQLLPNSDSCGSASVIFSGGNLVMDCYGGGAQLQAPGGYANMDTISEGPWCLNTDSSYQIIYIDDWGDGGIYFDIFIDSFPVFPENTGSGSPSTILPFVVSPPLAYDMEGHHIPTYTYQQIGNVDIKGHLFSRSANVIDTLDVNYQIDGGSVITSTLTGVNIQPFTDYDFTHPVPWVPSVNGTYNVKLWVDNLNGNADMDNNNDTIFKTIIVGPGIPNIIDSYIGITAPYKTVIAKNTDGIIVPRDLDFHPTLTNFDCWVILKSTEASGGKTVKISNAGQVGQTELVQQDGNAWHFMSLPTGIAFSENENFATSPGVFDANHDGGNPYTGPTLWSSDPTIYAQPSGGNGSHIDMLHESPYAMGIAHEYENAFWVNDSYNNCITRFDFGEDHGPGMHYHGDGTARRYTGMGIVEESTRHVPSHMVLDKATGWLYIVDTGNDRVIRMDINSGSATGTFTPYENIAESSVYTGFTYGDYIDTGLTQPCGIDIIQDRMIVSDYTTGEIIIYDRSGATGVELARLQTYTPGVMGVKIGPDGKIWYVNATTNQVVRLETIESISVETETSQLEISVFPNPTDGNLYVSCGDIKFIGSDLTITDISGKVKMAKKITSHHEMIDMAAYTNGIYFVTIMGNGIHQTKKIIKN